MATSYRRDPLWASALRGLTLAVSMLPLLYFSSHLVFVQPQTSVPLIILASLASAAGNWSLGTSLTYLPVGISGVLSNVSSVVMVSIVGFYFLGDRISLAQAAWIAAVLVTSSVLMLVRTKVVGATGSDSLRGFAFSFLSGFLACIGVFCMVSVSRTEDPMLAGYLWESIIGIVAGSAALVRNVMFQGSSFPGWGETRKIFWCAAPTALGTGFYAYAGTIGPIQILSALLVGGVIITVLLSDWIHHEKVSGREWMAIVGVVLSIVGLRLADW